MKIKRQRVKVIMLPTEDIKRYALYTHRKGYLIEGICRIGEPNGTQQHLYFTTDEEIKEGDWQINTLTNTVSIRKDWLHHGNIGRTRKIVATTDTSLGLPEPSQAFIQKYCELGGIEEVDLEYDEIEIYSNKGTSNIPSRFSYYQGVTTKIKTDSHNTITIHSIKDSWSREELTDILQVYRLDYEQYKRSCHYGPNQKEIVDWSNKWIKENL